MVFLVYGTTYIYNVAGRVVFLVQDELVLHIACGVTYTTLCIAESNKLPCLECLALFSCSCCIKLVLIGFDGVFLQGDHREAVGSGASTILSRCGLQI